MPQHLRQRFQQLLLTGKRTKELKDLRALFAACLKHGSDRHSHNRKRHIPTLH